MKSNKVVKFTLTAICMAVLSACGSSGDDNPSVAATTNTPAVSTGTGSAGSTSTSTGSTSTTTTDAAAKAAAEKAAAEAAAKIAAAEKELAAAKAAAEKAAADAAAAKVAAEKLLADAAAKKAAEEAAAKAAEAAAIQKAAEEAAAKLAAEKAALENGVGKDSVAVTTPFAKGQESNEGAKNVVLHTDSKGVATSNLNWNGKKATDIANVPTGMNMNLHQSLDTVVVLTTAAKAGESEKRGYLEDFDFRGADSNTATTGKYSLEKIYVQKGITDGGTNSGDKRDTDSTKTSTRGTGSGDALVLQKGRVNYSRFDGRVVHTNGTLNTAVEKNQAPRVLDGTVAEVYGHLTFADGKVTDRISTNNQPKNLVGQANLPLAALDVEKLNTRSQLNHVQYGRVTTHLNGHSWDDYKEGVVDNTYVVNYGVKGQAGTEDHYMYRGVGNTTAQQLAKLSGQNFKYEGHAVSYGLDDRFQSFEQVGRPNALGNKYGFVSGNHVVADVDTAKNTVTGSIFNKWFDYTSTSTKPEDKIKRSDLVTFNGTLHKNGGITGTSTNVKDKSAGVFAATLFGEKAQEMGGSVASNDKTAAKAWGAVFGANRDTKIPLKTNLFDSTNSK